MEKILILLLAGKIFNRDAQYRNFQVMLVLPELVEILFFKMVERKTITLIFSTVKQNQCWDELVSELVSFGSVQGHAGGAVTGAEWEQLTGSCAAMSWAVAAAPGWAAQAQGAAVPTAQASAHLA